MILETKHYSNEKLYLCLSLVAVNE